jgi:hypothetical protein
MSPDGNACCSDRNPGSTLGTGGKTKPSDDLGVAMTLGRAVASTDGVAVTAGAGLGDGDGAPLAARIVARIETNDTTLPYLTLTDVSTDIPGRNG